MEIEYSSLAVYHWGMEFCSPRGTARKVRFEEITKVRIIPAGKSRVVKFYAGGRCVGICLSEGDQDKVLMKYLRRYLADKIKM